MKTTACLALLALSVSARAQKVYKCEVNGIVTFSQQECGKDAKEVMDIPKGSTATPPPPQSEALRDISDSVEDAQCRRDAQKLYIEPDTSEIDSLQAQIQGLESSHYMSNTRNGMTYTAQSQLMEQGDRERAASLRGVVATKQAQNEAIRTESRKAMQDALVRCDQQKSARESARQAGK